MFFLVYDKLIADKNYLTIQNLRLETMTDVKVVPTNGDPIKLGTLYPFSEYKFKLPKSVNENAISVAYTDEKNIEHEAPVIGYLVLAENSNYKYKIR